jgi:hypothetical protein
MAPIAVDVMHSAGDGHEPATGVTSMTIEHANGQNGAQKPRTPQVRQRIRAPRPPSAG